MRRARPLVLLWSVALGACGGPAPPDDAGLDARDDDDAAVDDDAWAERDAARDAAPDAGLDAPPDAYLAPSEPWLEDVTLAWGIDHVRDSVEGYETLTDRMGGGVCPIDADGAAPLDLVFAMRPTATSHTRLYVAHQPGGPGTAVHYTDETAARGLDDAGDVFSCLAFDADGDGDEDLALAGPGTVRLYRHDDALFTDVSESLGLTLDPRDVYTSASAGDVDHDGDVDLYVGGFMRFDTSRFAPGERCVAIPCVSSLYEFDGIGDLLLLREADGGYREAGAALAPDLGRDEMTFVTGILRMTGRGPVDLWVGNDLGARYRDRVLRWDEDLGGYHDVGIDVGLATNAHGYGVDTMGWSQGDLDGDGELDFVASSWPGDTTAAYFCAPLAEGGELCEERGRAIGLALGVGRFRWGLGLGDLDLDGDLDLVEATGHLYSQADLRMSADELQAPTLYENVGAGMLALRAFPEGDALAVRSSQRGLALVDLDDDGRLDVVMAPSRGAPRVLHNVRETAGHFLRLALRGQAAGARVEITWAGGRAVRAHPIGEGFMGNFDPRVHVGLPAGVSHVDVDVSWPSGRTSHEAGVAVDRELTIVEP
ncbi:MAG: FG-GAP-like repeat-containing protein [Sandaracinus sp.]